MIVPIVRMQAYSVIVSENKAKQNRLLAHTAVQHQTILIKFLCITVFNYIQTSIIIVCKVMYINLKIYTIE